MIKTLNNTIKQDRTAYKIPRSVQDVIPIQRIFADGIFQFGTKYSRTLRFSDINYAIASKEDKTAMFLGYSELLNALDSGSTTKLTICNKQVNRQAFEDTVLLPQRGDSLDRFVDEFNGMLTDKISGSSASVEQERFITVSVHKKNVDEARTVFSRVTGEVSSELSRLNSSSNELDAAERLDVLRGFFRPNESSLPVDLQSAMKRGHNLKDTICPDSLEFHRDYFKMGNQYGRVLFLKDYASYIKDSMILELTDLNRRMMLSIDMIPVPTDEAVREVENKLLGVETNVTNWQRRQNSNQNFSAVVPYDLEQQRKETREMLDDLTTRDQRMLFAVVTLVHLADSKEELDSDTETLQSIARKHLCQLAKLSFQQQDGLITALPLGLRRIDALRTLTTEALAVLMPFKAQEIRHRHGIYYGQNAISKNLILADRKDLLNGNGFILGVSGSGKSFAAKREITEIALSTNDDIIIIDPEAEYRPLVEGLGGEVIEISATSPNHINALDMESGYNDGDNPVVLKSEFLLSLCEQLVGAGKLSAKEKSIIDRCTAQVYREFIRNGYLGAAPTLQDFHAALLEQPEPEARDVALALELFTEGSLNTFVEQTKTGVKTKDKLGHDFTVQQHDETQHWNKCSRCDEIDEKENHSGGAATCTAAAICETCGTAYSTVDADNHSFGAPDYAWNGTSCTARRVCTRDENHVESEDVQAVVTVTQNQSCTADELSTYTATFKNAAFAAQTKTGVKTKDKLGHDFTGTWQSNSDNHWKKCSRCDETADSAEHTWDNGRVTTAASCTQAGVKTFTCNVCSATKVEQIGATGHSWAEDWMFDTTHHWHKCLNGCTEKSGYTEHSGGTATCTEKAVCAVCETANGAVNAANHTGEKVWSTQTETNHEQKWSCCGAVSVENESHEWADGVCSECGYACLHADAADDGDCLTPVVCPVCNATIKAAETAHKWGRYMLTKPATMTSEGIETRYCQNPGCEQTQTRTVARLAAPSAPDKTEKDSYRTCRRDSTCPIEPYTDAVNTAWYHDGVHFCLESGLMAGVSAASFLPDGSVTRAQVVTILWRQEGRPAVNYAMQFKDVPAGEWFTEAVRWAVSSGVVTGYSDTAFGPNDAITREQFAAILYRYAQYKGMDVSAGGDTDILGFDDAPSISAYAVPAIRWACGSGVISGVSAHTLAPQGLTSRAQAACMIQRFLTGIK